VHTIFHPVNGLLRFSADLADASKRRRPSGIRGTVSFMGDKDKSTVSAETESIIMFGEVSRVSTI
jgi:hypothetical protein